jgi:hypothetical protein
VCATVTAAGPFVPGSLFIKPISGLDTTAPLGGESRGTRPVVASHPASAAAVPDEQLELCRRSAAVWLPPQLFKIDLKMYLWSLGICNE